MALSLSLFAVGCGGSEEPDDDGDGVINSEDNCVETENSDQKDPDGDGLGNACDNCPEADNAEQADADDDATGDACDGDIDGDQFDNDADNCPRVANAAQTDTDGNGTGDACDSDTDGDEVDDGDDNCPYVANPDQENSDDDDTGDACTGEEGGADADGDGVPDSEDNCPQVANPTQGDADDDGAGDRCDIDSDSDEDGLLDANDNCPDTKNEEQNDTDGDGVGEPCDNCTQVENADQSDLDGDGSGDRCDSCIPGGPQRDQINYGGMSGSGPVTPIWYTADNGKNEPEADRLRDLGAADYDGDGLEDLGVYWFTPERLNVFRARPDGSPPDDTFRQLETVNPGRPNVEAFTFVDLNADDYPDAVLGNVVAYNREADDGSRQMIVDTEDGFLEGGQPDKLLAGDFDADGYGDVVKQVALSDKIVLFLNDGEGGLQQQDLSDPRGKLSDDGAGLQDTDIADFDGDGTDDIITLWDTNQVAILMKLDSDSPALNVVDLETQNSEATYAHVAGGSIEQDETIDFAVASERQGGMGGISRDAEVAVYENQGEAKEFSRYFHTKTAADVEGLMLEDISFDGYADVMVGPLFWRHSYEGDNYENCGAENCRIELEWERAEAATQFIRADVTSDQAPELVAIHDDFKFTVLRPYCP